MPRWSNRLCVTPRKLLLGSLSKVTEYTPRCLLFFSRTFMHSSFASKWEDKDGDIEVRGWGRRQGVVWKGSGQYDSICRKISTISFSSCGNTQAWGCSWRVTHNPSKTRRFRQYRQGFKQHQAAKKPLADCRWGSGRPFIITDGESSKASGSQPASQQPLRKAAAPSPKWADLKDEPVLAVAI